MEATEPRFFQVGRTTIDLGDVIDFAQPSKFGSELEANQLIMVHMENDSYITIKGRLEVAAFVQAMENYHGANLI